MPWGGSVLPLDASHMTTLLGFSAPGYSLTTMSASMNCVKTMYRPRSQPLTHTTCPVDPTAAGRIACASKPPGAMLPG